MSGGLVRDVFIVSQDPFWFNSFVFDLWLEGFSLQEAVHIRTKLPHVAGADFHSADSNGEAILPHQLVEDCVGLLDSRAKRGGGGGGGGLKSGQVCFFGRTSHGVNEEVPYKDPIPSPTKTAKQTKDPSSGASEFSLGTNLSKSKKLSNLRKGNWLQKSRGGSEVQSQPKRADRLFVESSLELKHYLQADQLSSLHLARFLVEIDTTHNYHVFELLTTPLSLPDCFIMSPPLQIRLRERKAIVRRYYDMTETVLLEVCRWKKILVNKRKIKLLAERVEQSPIAVKRQVENLHRVYQRLRVGSYNEWLEMAFGPKLARLYLRYAFLLHYRIALDAKRCLTFEQTDRILKEFLEVLQVVQAFSLEVPPHVVDYSKSLRVALSKSTHFDEWRSRVSISGNSGMRFGLEGLRVAARLRPLLGLLTMASSTKRISSLFALLLEFIDRTKPESVEFLNVCETAIPEGCVDAALQPFVSAIFEFLRSAAICLLPTGRSSSECHTTQQTTDALRHKRSSIGAKRSPRASDF